MNTIEQTNDVVNEIRLLEKSNGKITLILYNGEKLENIKVKNIQINEEEPETAVVVLEYFTKDNKLSKVNLFQVKTVV
jgi:hypothetical protein